MDSKSVDLVDVRTVLEFEQAVAAFRGSREVVWPALERLRDAGYPGAEALVDHFLDDEAIENLAESLEDMRLAGGNLAASDYFFFVKRRRGDETAADALEVGVKHLVEWENGPARVAAMIRYAESVA